ncbi:MAG: 4'-phosphopantetheinyl transferase superfamily protein [Pseudomonadota bacterium]
MNSLPDNLHLPGALAQSADPDADGVARWSWDLPGQAPLTLFMVRFDASRFGLDQFARSGLSCPPTIVNSVQKRQAEFYFGRACARAALRALGMPATPVGVGVAREPLWPPGAIGSITHKKKAAAAAVLGAGHYRGIGIDIEDVVESASARDAMLAMVVSPRELALLRQPELRMPLDVALTLVFSAKESFFKACYPTVQRYFDFDALDLQGIDAQRRTISFALRETLCAPFVPGMVVSVAFELLAAGEVITLFLW